MYISFFYKMCFKNRLNITEVRKNFVDFFVKGIKDIMLLDS